MQPLRPSDIQDHVHRVLANAHQGKGHRPHFLTAYQVLDRLPPTIRDRLLEERGLPGKGAGVYHAAASVVMHALRSLGTQVEITYLDDRGAGFEVAGQMVEAGYPVCGLYRLRIDGDEVEEQEP